MTNQYALGYKAGLEAAVKVCEKLEEADLNAQYISQSKSPTDCIAAIESLPAPEVQWRDLTDDDIALINLDYPSPQGFARAVIAKFKEKQL